MGEPGELWRAYLAWCEGTKTKQAFKRSNEFCRNLLGRDNIEARRDTGKARTRFLSGIGLQDASGPPPDAGCRTTSDDKTPFCETLSREAHIEKVRENAICRPMTSETSLKDCEPDIFEADENDGDGGDPGGSPPAIHMAERPGKCIHCDGRTEHTLEGEYFCYSCYKRFYTQKMEVN